MRVMNFSDVDFVCYTKTQKIILKKNDVTEVDDDTITEKELMGTYGSYIRILPTLTRPADAEAPVDEVTVEDAIDKAKEVVNADNADAEAPVKDEKVKTETKKATDKKKETQAKNSKQVKTNKKK